MYNANKVAIYLTAIDSAPSYSVNVFVVKPMAVTTTSFFFHTLLIFTARTTLCVNNINSVFRVHNKIILSFLCEY